MKIWGMPLIVYALVPVGLALDLAKNLLVEAVLFPFDVLEQLKWTSRR